MKYQVIINYEVEGDLTAFEAIRSVELSKAVRINVQRIATTADDPMVQEMMVDAPF
jgi:hypothetical protein